MTALVRQVRIRGYLFLSVLPILLLAGDASAGSYGACVVRDALTDLPDYWDPDLAPGYAKLSQPSNDVVTLWQLCTDDVYETLMQLHCSCNPNPQMVQWQVVAYSSLGFCDTTCRYPCAGSGCEFHTCAGVPTISCPPGTIADLVDSVRGLNASGALNDGQGNALVSKLQSALTALQNGNTTSARNKLNAFINQVESLVAAGVLPAADGQALVDAANAILAGL